jgi:hypothetical protein
MQQRYDLSEYGPGKTNAGYNLEEFAPQKQRQLNPLELFRLSKQQPSGTLGQSLGQQELIPGIKEGFQESAGAIPGIGQYAPKFGQQPPVTNESTRNIGRFIGGAAPFAAIAAPIAATGGALGIPAGIAEIGGMGAAGALTTPGNLFERGIGAAKGAVAGSAGKLLTKLPEVSKVLFSKVNPKEWVYGIQKAHDTAMKRAGDIYDFIKSEVKPRGVSNINIPTNILKEASDYLPKTRSSKQLIENAKTGDYEALHQLQSDLGKKGSENLSGDTYADRNMGEQMMDVRDKINEAIRSKFKAHGHEDLAKLLDEANKKYKSLKDIYYSHPTVGKIVHPNIRKVPKNPEKVFQEESKSMEKLLQAHPEIVEGMKLSSTKQKIMKQLKRLGYTGLGLEALKGTQEDISKISNLIRR